ncbi:hypothetical protein BDQ12DRAFT_687937 [Crucibulum laeve]|uniref:Uncharacterized protein n=1 Tax=Crucibulum laeve TaxID=68775 RepID=A0A5C3LRW2_9AGAR|nr:hypothetical protein BDQ12DRAFT_687937 [Crucibulum laeve]
MRRSYVEVRCQFVWKEHARGVRRSLVRALKALNMKADARRQVLHRVTLLSTQSLGCGCRY